TSGRGADFERRVTLFLFEAFLEEARNFLQLVVQRYAIRLGNRAEILFRLWRRPAIEGSLPGSLKQFALRCDLVVHRTLALRAFFIHDASAVVCRLSTLGGTGSSDVEQAGRNGHQATQSIYPRNAQ